MPSTSLRDIVYDASARTLEVTFLASGRRYRSFDVAPEEHAALRHAVSRGTPSNRNITPAHRFVLTTVTPLIGPVSARPISATMPKHNRSA
jgi:hypothetical protein